MSAARILIITNGALCRNPRVAKEAATLGGAGHDVVVLTVRNHAASEEQDLELLRHAPYRRETVDFLAARDPRRFPEFRRQLVYWLARKLTHLTGWQTPRALGPMGSLRRRARRIPADLTIVHNEVAHWVGVSLLREGRRVAADIEDWHSEDLLPADRRHRPLRLLRETERTLLHRAVYTTTTSRALSEGLHRRYGGNQPHVITNSFPLQPPPARSCPGDPPTFFWFSQTLGRGRGLEQFIAAWTQTRQPSRLVLLGESHGGFDAELRAHLPKSFRERLSFLPLVPPGELPALIAKHDIGLALEQAVIPNRDLTITNKIIQYLNAGLAVVASDTAGQREVLARDPMAGVIVPTEDTAGFARQLDELLADRGQLAVRQRAARKLAETVYCWEREAPRLLELVDKALRTSVVRPA